MTPAAHNAFKPINRLPGRLRHATRHLPFNYGTGRKQTVGQIMPSRVTSTTLQYYTLISAPPQV